MSETNRTQVSKDSMIVYPGKGRILMLSILSLAFVAVLKLERKWAQ
ncbi:hypothetical protein [Lederbergia ruris]|uniref:Uncharacterized protein n=1 Tax=Lederbergia ruris TaxID=217495 RepID=A0ABQ4KQX1_9BACI|nr:hypothetical protein [Lederbergia ruris]GIN59878.1 hypothetical protein J8TS2_41970 [Lederbergia ruris]